MSPFSRALVRHRYDRVPSPVVIRRIVAAVALASVFGMAGAVPPEPLELTEVVRLAELRAPRVAAQQAALAAAGAEAVRAPELPDPQLVAGVESLPLGGSERFSLTRDSMTMRTLGVMQQFPRKEKRRLRGETAQAEVEAEAARLTAERLVVHQQAAEAWIDRLYAEREQALVEALQPELDAQVATARAVFRGGGGSAADVLAAQGARAQLDDRLDAIARTLAQAQATLARWLGPEATQRPLAAPPDFTALPEAPATLLAHLERHGALLPYAAMETAAETRVALARAEKKPDWSLEVGYAQRGPAFSNLLSVQIRVDLPLFPARRQDAAIAARLAELDKVQAERVEAERMHREEMQQTLAAWQAADRRTRRYDDELLALAEQRVQVALAAYRGGRGDIQPLLAARSAAIEARLAQVEQQRERARAWAALRYLLPTEATP